MKAPRASFPTRAKAPKRRPLRAASTFIQRSRGVSSEEKAIYHNVTGAGRSHVVRRFFWLSDEEQLKVKALLERGMTQRIDGLAR